jgi:hypothetical protein
MLVVLYLVACIVSACAWSDITSISDTYWSRNCPSTCFDLGILYVNAFYQFGGSRGYNIYRPLSYRTVCVPVAYIFTAVVFGN